MHTTNASRKRNKILYWIFTIWMSLGMLSSAAVQLFRVPEEMEMITRMGYPEYFITIIAVWKLLGVIAVLLPGLPLLKEWAYAGFFFAMSGAAISHTISADAFSEIFPSLLLLTLTLLSWYFRPADRRTVAINHK